MKTHAVFLAALGLLLFVGTSRAAAPANDNFASAEVLPSTNSFTINGTTASATMEPGDPVSSGDRDVWYSWTAQRCGLVTISITSEDIKHLAVLAGAGQLSGQFFAGSMHYSSTAGPTTEVPARFYANAGQTYHFCVYTGKFTDGDAFTLGLNCDASLDADTLFVFPNANDDFANALNLNGGKVSFVQHMLNATFEPFEQSMLATLQYGSYDHSGAGGVWVNYTAPATGTVYFSARNIAGTSVALVVGTGDSIATLNFLAAARSATQFHCVQGTTYRLYLFSQYGHYPDYIKTTEVVAKIEVKAAGGTGGTATPLSLRAGTFRGAIGARGYLTLVLGKTGSFSGKFVLDGFTQSIKGKFDADGDFVGAFGKSLVVVNLHLDLTGTVASVGSYQVSGTVGGISVDANHAVYVKGQTLADVGRYTALLPPASPGGSIPSGTGYATLVVGKTGAAALAGKLGDGRAFSSSVPIVGGSDGNQGVFYAALSYPSLATKGSKGFLMGSVTFEDLAGSDFDGVWRWVKPAQTKGAYPAAIDTTLNAAGSVYATPKGQSVLPGFVSGTLEFADGGAFSTPLDKSVTLTSANKLVITNPALDKTKVKITAATGLITGTLSYPDQKKPVAYGGVLFQKQSKGGGFYAGPSGSGKVTLRTP